MIVVAFIRDPNATKQVLDHLRLDGSVPPLKPSRGPPPPVQGEFPVVAGPELDDDGLPVFRHE